MDLEFAKCALASCRKSVYYFKPRNFVPDCFKKTKISVDHDNGHTSHAPTIRKYGSAHSSNWNLLPRHSPPPPPTPPPRRRATAAAAAADGRR